MWFDKSEFTKCLALQETAVSRDPETSQLSFAKLPGVMAAQVPCPGGRSFESCPGSRESSLRSHPEGGVRSRWSLDQCSESPTDWSGAVSPALRKEAGGCGAAAGPASRLGVAHWCTSAWGKRTWQSCWPECSCSPLRRRAAGRPGAAAAAEAAGGAAPPSSPARGRSAGAASFQGQRSWAPWQQRRTRTDQEVPEANPTPVT